MSKSRNTAKKSFGSASETDSLTMPQSGLMCERLMDGPSLARWASSLPDFPVSPIASQGNEKGQQMKGTSGRTPLESFGKWDQDGCCWRTYQASLLTGTLEPLSGSFPKSGMTASGTAYLLLPLVPRSCVGAGGVLPAPQTTDSDPNGGPPNKNANTTRWQGVNSLGQMAKTGMWPTPRTSSGGGNKSIGVNAPYRPALVQAVKLWPAPKARDWKHSAPHGDGGPDLPVAAGGQLNPTWVEWLMGLPLGWTDLKPLAMESYRQWYESFCGGVEAMTTAANVDPIWRCPRCGTAYSNAEAKQQSYRCWRHHGDILDLGEMPGVKLVEGLTWPVKP